MRSHTVYHSKLVAVLMAASIFLSGCHYMDEIPFAAWTVT